MWDIEKTRKLVEMRFGNEQLQFAKPSLQSVNDRLSYAKYHNKEIKTLFSSFKEQHLGPGESLLGLTDDGELEFQHMVIKIGANAVACLQSIHAVGDILANAIHYSIGLNLLPGAPPEHRIDLKLMKEKLKTISVFSALVNEIDLLTSSQEYKYLNAATNLSKHRHVVSPAFSEDWTDPDGKIHEVKFTDFTYDGNYFPSKPIEKTLSPVFNGFSRIIVNAGNLINDYLENNFNHAPN